MWDSRKCGQAKGAMATGRASATGSGLAPKRWAAAAEAGTTGRDAAALGRPYALACNDTSAMPPSDGTPARNQGRFRAAAGSGSWTALQAYTLYRCLI